MGGYPARQREGSEGQVRQDLRFALAALHGQPAAPRDVLQQSLQARVRQHPQAGLGSEDPRPSRAARDREAGRQYQGRPHRPRDRRHGEYARQQARGQRVLPRRNEEVRQGNRRCLALRRR